MYYIHFGMDWGGREGRDKKGKYFYILYFPLTFFLGFALCLWFYFNFLLAATK